jgi:hypothetical protein
MSRFKPPFCISRNYPKLNIFIFLNLNSPIFPLKESDGESSISAVQVKRIILNNDLNKHR